MDPAAPIEEVRRLSGDDKAAWIEPPKRTLFVGVPSGSPWKELSPRRMLFVEGLYLVETADDPGTWWMGQTAGDGTVHVWGNYGALEDAIAGL